MAVEVTRLKRSGVKFANVADERIERFLGEGILAGLHAFLAALGHALGDGFHDLGVGHLCLHRSIGVVLEFELFADLGLALAVSAVVFGAMGFPVL